MTGLDYCLSGTLAIYYRRGRSAGPSQDLKECCLNVAEALAGSRWIEILFWLQRNDAAAKGSSNALSPGSITNGVKSGVSVEQKAARLEIFGLPATSAVRKGRGSVAAIYSSKLFA